MKVSWIFIAALVSHLAVRCTSAQSPSQREDAMGKYFVMSRYQCQLLCWYRKLCKTYSYMYDSVQALDGNCVLHAANITTTTTNMVPTGWIEREATSNPTTQSTTCRSRPCEDTEMCFPTYTSPFYTCHPVFAECQAPPQTDGVYSNVTLLQGQRTNFTCNSSLLWAPRHADKTVTCQVTGRYSELKGTCKNAIYYSPSVPFNKPLPDVVMRGWEACFKGIFIGSERMSFSFHDSRMLRVIPILLKLQHLPSALISETFSNVKTNSILLHRSR
ncbi:uncharacterized protein LOC112570323 [Pomacea canaliculata]|uniref:uncharacterized protein LOC112570323 n=1 Tax=Pomacea canaliculata TaxID=400727 RepID=UPI000D736719|nr:uncharacterized protein LOC112570323 [Pomacea canaliculata]